MAPYHLANTTLFSNVTSKNFHFLRAINQHRYRFEHGCLFHRHDTREIAIPRNVVPYPIKLFQCVSSIDIRNLALENEPTARCTPRETRAAEVSCEDKRIVGIARSRKKEKASYESFFRKKHLRGNENCVLGNTTPKDVVTKQVSCLALFSCSIKILSCGRIFA